MQPLVRMLTRIFAGLLLCLSLPSQAQSEAVELWVSFDRPLQQGAMVIGKTNAEHVSLLGRTVTVAEDGHFVFGLGRDQGDLELSLTTAGVEPKILQYPVARRSYKTQSIEGVEQKYVSPPPEVTERIQRDIAEARAARSHTLALHHYLDTFIWPAEGPVTGVYGSQRIFNGVPKRPHYGLDIAGPVGTPIVAPASGVVTLANPDMYYSGGTLIVDHGQGISSTFIHLSRIDVAVGDTIEQGQKIAEMGGDWARHRPASGLANELVRRTPRSRTAPASPSIRRGKPSISDAQTTRTPCEPADHRPSVSSV